MTEPTPAPVRTPAQRLGDTLGARIDFTDRRTQLGLLVLAFCGGICIGARLMKGVTTPPATTAPLLGGAVVAPVHDQPCAGCRERELQAQRARDRERAAAQAAAADPAVATAQDQAAADQAERDATQRRQLEGTEGMRSFSPYAEATLPAEQVESGPVNTEPGPVVGE